MDAETILKDAYDEVLKKIGRNLLAFQMAEQILKELLRLGGFARRSSAPEESFGEIAERAKKMTLGGLTTLFTKTHCSDRAPVFPELPENSTDGMIAISFAFKLGEHGLAARRESFATLVAERNRLVHHLLPEFDRDSLASCQAAAADLDRQRELVLPEIKCLQENYRFVSHELSNLATFMASPEGIDFMRVPSLQQHPLIEEFAAFARDNPAPADWISLSAAAGRIVGFSRDEISAVCESFSQKSLTALMIASQLFDIEFELTKTNSHRVLYRLSQGAGSSSSDGNPPPSTAPTATSDA